MMKVKQSRNKRWLECQVRCFEVRNEGICVILTKFWHYETFFGGFQLFDVRKIMTFGARRVASTGGGLEKGLDGGLGSESTRHINDLHLRDNIQSQ